MKIVLDANVVVAAFASHGLCETIFEYCLDSHDILVSESLIDDIRRNLIKKIKLPQQLVRQIVALLRENATILEPHPLPSDVSRDPDDAAVLGLAVVGKADYLVTGDKDLLALKQFEAIQIVSPRDFSTKVHEA
ncbi:MAG: putative toxin-antitoxin system toxin component, PIN family [Planctomycetes bacterium]|nr:putative toxin-antitoxin system toxin component, PIN family [Planctomycetota bacterium]